jgi:hypothetical protein
MALLLLTIAFAPAASAVLVEWPVASGGNGHFYEAVAFGADIDWPQAKIEAEDRGGHLATVNSGPEGDFIVSSVIPLTLWQPDTRGPGFPDLFGPWIGGLQPAGIPAPADGWQWITAESFSPTFWAAGEPNDINDESFLHFYGKNSVVANTWNDYRNGNPLGGGNIRSFVVEYTGIPEASSMIMGSLLSCALAVAGWCRRLYNSL